MSSNSLFSSDSSIKNSKREPPKPIKQNVHIPIMPISTNQFPPFTYFYLCISRATNLHNCSLHSLYLLIRTHPSLQPIITPNAWCNDSEANFNCGYSLDFTNVPHFNLGDFTPVLELYIRYSKKSQLVGVCFLPLKVLQTININQKPLTYLYQNTPVELQDIASKRVVGSIFVTIALGEREHQTILDPNSPLFSNPQNFNLQSQQNPINNEPNNDRKSQRRDSRDYYSDYSYSDYSDYYEEDEDDWITEAMKHGWVKPGSTGNWKEKALKKGWKPPVQVATYSVSIECDLDDRMSMGHAGCQTAQSIIDDDLNELVGEYQNAEDQFKSAKKDINDLCNYSSSNQQKKQPKPSMKIDKPIQIYTTNSSIDEKKQMSISNNIIYSDKTTYKITDDEIQMDIDNIHESLIDKINEEEEEEDIDELMLKVSQMQNVKSKSNSSKNFDNNYSESGILSFENEEDGSASELIVTGSHHNSSNSSKKSITNSNSNMSSNQSSSSSSNSSIRSNRSNNSKSKSNLSTNKSKDSSFSLSSSSQNSDLGNSKKGKKSKIPKRESQIHEFDTFMSLSSASSNDKNGGSILINGNKLLPKILPKQDEEIEEEEESESISDINKTDSKINPIRDDVSNDSLLNLVSDDNDENENQYNQEHSQETDNTNDKIPSPIKISSLSDQLGLNNVELPNSTTGTFRYSSLIGTQKPNAKETSNLSSFTNQSQQQNIQQIGQSTTSEIHSPIRLDQDPHESDSSTFF